jgi:hypothetical protein
MNYISNTADMKQAKKNLLEAQELERLQIMNGSRLVKSGIRSLILKK